MEVPEEFKFPKTTNIRAWMNYLGRKLGRREFSIIHSVVLEKEFNDKMDELYSVSEKKGLYVPELTDLHGDCMFESLNYHGIGNNVHDLRNSLATIMYLYQDYKNFFPTQETTLKELFEAMNDIKYVSCRHKTDNSHCSHDVEFYKYSYNIMCQDITTMHSWDLLPTQLILMVVSLIYQVEICIINNTSEYEHSINVYEGVDGYEDKIKKIYIGHLGESHYLPLDIIKDDEDVNPPQYKTALAKFIKWGRYVEREMYTHYLIHSQNDVNSDNDSDSDSDNHDNNNGGEFYDLSQKENLDNSNNVNF